MPRYSTPTTSETIFLAAMTAVYISAGVLASFGLTWPVSAIHWIWSILGGVTLYHVYGCSLNSSKFTTRAYWYMAIAAQTLILEIVSLFTAFCSLNTQCQVDDAYTGVVSVSQECIWAGVYQFHGIYLSFIHIIFFVLMNCCIQDAMKDREDGAVIKLYLNWHNFTALPFAALFFNMVAIVMIQKYIHLFDEWNDYVAYIWIVLKGLALGNIVFNLVMFWWFIQNHREITRIEVVLSHIPFLNVYFLSKKQDLDLEKARLAA
ncbi:UNVERIFIED_CONTAM: hypothetical protein HDU68_010200 [Siphonaria sp. JEL0065]|nr:hypothetical protein HDU68_010200 [Siphonaria sp. JEL0065]